MCQRVGLCRLSEGFGLCRALTCCANGSCQWAVSVGRACGLCQWAVAVGHVNGPWQWAVPVGRANGL